MYRLIQIFARAKRGDDDRHPESDACLHIAFQAIIGTMHDLIDCKRCRRRIRMLLVEAIQFFRDSLQPDIELPGRPCVQGRERSDDAGLALRNRSEEHTSELQSLMRIPYAV